MPVSVSQHCVAMIQYDITIHTHLKFTEIHHGFTIHEKATSTKLKSQKYPNTISILVCILSCIHHIFSCKKTSLATFSGSNLLRFSLKMFPATSSKRRLVAGILKYHIANLAINGYWLSLIFHHIGGLSSMSIHSSLLYLSTSATTHSSLDFFDLSYKHLQKILIVYFSF